MAINKVIYGGDTLIDLTSDTVTPQTLATGATAHDRSGAVINGSYTGIPAGGSTGQVLAKDSDDDYEVDWMTINVPTKTSDLTNDSEFITGMTILSYGNSTWNDFLTAYNANKVVYCRASSNSNPATGNQTRMAFMAYVNANPPTNVEFQYYRSVNSHSATQQGDQVYVYKLDKTAGWSVTVRENYTKIVAGTGLSSAYSNGALTLSNSNPLPTVSSSDNGKVLRVVSGAWSAVELPSASGVSF